MFIVEWVVREKKTGVFLVAIVCGWWKAFFSSELRTLLGKV